MRTLPSFRSLVRTLLALCALVASAAIVDHFTGHHGLFAHAAAPLMLGGLREWGRTYDDLKSLMQPDDANQPESVPHVLFDRQPYAAAGSTTLKFFQSFTAANLGDLTLSNFPTGQLEAGFYFEVHRVFAWIDAMPANTASNAVAGPANDVEILHKTARGVVTFALKGKTYPALPLGFFGRPGGPAVDFKIIGTAAAGSTQIGQTENNGGFPYLGNLVIPPATQFRAQMDFNSTAISALTNIAIGMMGILHRPLA